MVYSFMQHEYRGKHPVLIFFTFSCLLFINGCIKLKKTVLIKQLKEDNPEALRRVYVENRQAFFQFVKRYPIDKNMAEDIYQDAIIILRDNAKQGKLDSLTGSVRTYLFSIGKYLIYSHLRMHKKLRVVDDFSGMYDDETVLSKFIVERQEPKQESQKLQRALAQLGPKCYEILSLFYFRGFTLDEITVELNYSGKDVAKSQKSRCLKSLKQLLKT